MQQQLNMKLDGIMPHNLSHEYLIKPMVCSEAAARNMNAGLEICANFSPWRVKEVSDILSVPPSVVQVMNTECFAYFREGAGKRCFF